MSTRIALKIAIFVRWADKRDLRTNPADKCRFADQKPRACGPERCSCCRCSSSRQQPPKRTPKMTTTGFYFLTYLLLLSLHLIHSGSNAMWQWLCNQTSDSCEKMARNNHNSPQARRNLATCRLTCGKFGALWPKPTENCTLSKDLIQIDVE